MVHRNHDGRVTESHFRPNLSTNRLNRRVQFFDSPMETISNFPCISLLPSMDPSFLYFWKFCSLIIRISDEKSFKLSFKKNNDSCLLNFPFQDQTTRKPFLPSSSSSSSESQIAAAFEKPRTDNFAARWISNLGRDKCRTAGCSSSPRKRFSSKNKEMEIRVQTRGKSRVFTTGVERNTASI